VKVISFEEAIADAERHSKRHLLLGNGFSIACRPKIFAYGRLYEQANFDSISPTSRLAFQALGTQDFERVIKALRDTARIVDAYDGPPSLAEILRKDSERLRELLVQTIAASHPAWPGELGEAEYLSCDRFLSHFNTIYTLNYDLLLYWVRMHASERKGAASDDGFRTSEDDTQASYVVWEPGQSHGQDMWFLHGALHVFDSGTEIQKYTWAKTGIRLIEQIREALSRDYFPIFVSEGTSAEKYERIRHNDYLAKGYRSFQSIGGSLFIFGHSLAENDDHYLRCIRKGKLRHAYIGIYGDPNSSPNKFIVRRAEELSRDRGVRNPLAVTFYDAESANVWKT
jgi:hypothetical protein